MHVQQIVDVIDSILANGFPGSIVAVLHNIVAKLVRMAVLKVRIRIDIGLRVSVKASKAQFVTLALRKSLLIGEQDVEHLHHCLIWPAAINLQHEVVKIPHVLHPAACEHVWLLDVLERLDTKDLDSLQVLNKLGLVVPNVVRKGGLLLLHPFVRRAKWSAIAAELFRWNDCRRLALASTGELGALDFLRLGWRDRFLVNMNKVFLLFLDRLGMLVRFVVRRWQVGDFLDLFPLAFDLQGCHVLL